MADTIGHTFIDSITGFRGVCVGHVKYITGCDQLLLQPKSDTGTKREASEWFDVLRVSVDPTAPRVVIDNANGSGADRAAPYK